MIDSCRRGGSASLVVFSDDWGRHPSSCQHLVKRLLPDYEVLWVNTIGTRPPRFNMATLRRAAGKIAEWSGPNRSDIRTTLTASPEVMSPVMWPWFRSASDRWINRSLLKRAVNRRLRNLPCPQIAITTVPIAADLVGALEVDAWLYYCVDDLSAWPGLDGDVLRRMEENLISRCDHVVAVSEYLGKRIRERGREPALITHGVELEHWRENGGECRLIPAEAAAPRVVFWGLLDQRLEHDWIARLADQLAAGSVVLVGPVESMDPKIAAHPRIFMTGPVGYHDLPALTAEASVLVMPYKDLPVTKAMQPLKLKEYLATGLPCVVRQLPSTVPWADCLDLVNDSGQFVHAVNERISGELPELQAVARARLSQESWDAKAADFRSEIERLVAAC